jgi:hypothetical protein
MYHTSLGPMQSHTGSVALVTRIWANLSICFAASCSPTIVKRIPDPRPGSGGEGLVIGRIIAANQSPYVSLAFTAEDLRAPVSFLLAEPNNGNVSLFLPPGPYSVTISECMSHTRVFHILVRKDAVIDISTNLAPDASHLDCQF